MPKCSHCGAVSGLTDTLFCPWCGAQAELESPRMAEAICVETIGDVATPLLPYGSRLPAHYSEVFSTSEDNQTTVHIHLVVGNSAQASQNRPMLSITFPILARAPRAVPRVELTLRVEATGAIRLRVHEQGTDNVLERDDLCVAVAAPRA